MYAAHHITYNIYGLKKEHARKTEQVYSYDWETKLYKSIKVLSTF